MEEATMIARSSRLRQGYWLTCAIFTGCIGAAACAMLSLGVHAADKPLEGHLTYIPLRTISPELYNLGEAQRRALAEGRYLEPDYLYPQAEPPRSSTLLVPPWEVGRNVARTIPNYHAGMVDTILVAPMQAVPEHRAPAVGARGAEPDRSPGK
jgi:hypothetical protein